MEDKSLPFPEDKILFPDESKYPLVVQNVFGTEITKSSLKNKAKEIVANLLDAGEDDPLRLYVSCKVLSEYLSELLSGLKEEATEGAGKHGKGGDTYLGIKFEVANMPTQYDYSHDEVWQEFSDKVKEATDLRKKREDLMRKALDFSGVVDDDGVEIPTAKIKSGGGEVIKVTIPK